MKHGPRKSAPGVKNGRVLTKNRLDLTPSYWNTPQPVTVFDREKPGRGYRHLLDTRTLVDFVELLPEWEETSKGLDAVLLATGSPFSDGWYDTRVIGICAWQRNVEVVWEEDHVEAHASTLDRLNVPRQRTGRGVLCRFTEDSARAYQLLHVFLHELGHHRDLMTTRSAATPARGESFAESYALQYEDEIWERYARQFKI